ncbi:uncharacterized protein LOC121263416 isoform X2 [Juglans microcarpa x Juglans regia]|uniref:uncharacterized protein LOC121263416 isoform X2 n=1 Tax=Juglans microcarpa x Juglans regia TaxID=2249226 RepID=UPI001B7DB76E|nr:uncharacterized protein LOC121263416 isoform X2 [Juglans microcarpa x Juglans regia]
MQEKKFDVARRALNILRLALLWARKGGVFKRRIMVELRLLPKFIRSLAHSSRRDDRIHYTERELSFDETPIFHVKMHRPGRLRFHLPNIPCITPQVDFDYDFAGSDDHDDVYGYDHEDQDQDQDQERSYGICEEEEEEDGIDLRAEEFIAKFHEQMKLQRQISYLQYKEMQNS